VALWKMEATINDVASFRGLPSELYGLPAKQLLNLA
jgi:hypothetical protein